MLPKYAVAVLLCLIVSAGAASGSTEKSSEPLTTITLTVRSPRTVMRQTKESFLFIFQNYTAVSQTVRINLAPVTLAGKNPPFRPDGHVYPSGRQGWNLNVTVPASSKKVFPVNVVLEDSPPGVKGVCFEVGMEVDDGIEKHSYCRPYKRGVS